MVFHLMLPDIAESKTCSCDSLTPFYNPFYSQYHRTQRTSQSLWRTRCCIVVASHSNFLGRSTTRDVIRADVAGSKIVLRVLSSALYFTCLCRKLQNCTVEEAVRTITFNLKFYRLNHVDPTRPGPTRGSGQDSCNSGLAETLNVLIQHCHHNEYFSFW